MGKRKPRDKKISPSNIVLTFVASPDNHSLIGSDELVINFEGHVRRQCGGDEETASRLLNNRSKVITLERERRAVKGEMTNVFWFIPHPDCEDNLAQLFPALAV